MSLNIYFDGVKNKLDIERDAVLARRLDFTPQQLNRARKTGSCPDEILLKISEILGTPMEELALAREAAKSGALQPVWAKAYERVKRASAVAGIGAVLLSGSLSTEGKATTAQLDISQGLYYRKLSRAAKNAVQRFLLALNSSGNTSAGMA